MLIKRGKKHGRTVYVRDRGTEVFEKIGEFFNSPMWSAIIGGLLVSAVIVLGCLIGSAIIG